MLSPLITDYPIPSFSEKLLLWNLHEILILNLQVLEPSSDCATGMLIDGNIGDIVAEECAAQAYQEEMRKHKEDKLVYTLLRYAYNHLLNIYHMIEPYISMMPIWTALSHTSNFRQI